MWAAWKKKWACGFKIACGLASCISFCVVQGNVSCLENLSSGDRSNGRSLLASALCAADEQAVVSSSVPCFCCCVLRQDSNWDEGRGKFAVLWSYVQGLMWQTTACVWYTQFWSLKSPSSLMGAQCGCWLWCGCAVTACSEVSHRVNDFWLGFFQSLLVILVHLLLSPFQHGWQELIPKPNGNEVY